MNEMESGSDISASNAGDWEEIPAAMVDWDATEKARIADEKAEAALVKKVQAQEQARQVISVVDVDASLPVGQGVFLPTGEGMFAVTGKTVTPPGAGGIANNEPTRNGCSGAGHFSGTHHSGQA